MCAAAQTLPPGFLTYKAAVLTKLYEDMKPDIVKVEAAAVRRG